MPKPKRKSRKVDLRKIRPTKTYDLPELAKACDKAMGTIWRWRREGMPTLEGSNGKLVDGAEFIEWMRARQQARKRPCDIDEFYCFGGECRTQRKPAVGSLYIKKSNQDKCSIEANCEVCGCFVKKGGAMANIVEIEQALESYTGNVQDLARYRDSPFKRK